MVRCLLAADINNCKHCVRNEDTGELCCSWPTPGCGSRETVTNTPVSAPYRYERKERWYEKYYKSSKS